MIRTCSAPMPRERVCARSAEVASSRPGPTIVGPGRAQRGGFTLVELLVVMSFLSLLVMLAQASLFGVLRRSAFKSQVQDFVSTMQMAASGAAESDRRYEVIIDFAEQSYLLRQITSSDLSDGLEEAIITQGGSGKSCRV